MWAIWLQSESPVSPGFESAVGTLPPPLSSDPQTMSAFVLSCPRLSQAHEVGETPLRFRPVGPPAGAVFLRSRQCSAHPQGLTLGF